MACIAEMKDKIFDRFYEAINQEFQGSGLDLVQKHIEP